jgi:N-methylhydantoinase A
MTQQIIVAVDTGGTFTDVVAWRDGELVVVKTPSTPDDPARALLAGVASALGGRGRAFDLLIHGSTVATNALLERRGGRVVLVTNRGFEDVLVLGRQTRPQLYALTGVRDEPLVADAHRIGVGGRLDERGAELEPVDPAELLALAEHVRGLSPDAIAICLLHSYANAAHERAVADALGPLAAPCTLSAELLPEYREYERTATTVVNAYVAPLMGAYLACIEADAGARRVRIMGSGGGALPVGRARRDAAHTILSGPAGGVAGALHVARRHGLHDIMTFDMGGTSTDVSLCPGAPLHTRAFTIAGLPVALPVLDIHTVGAGGGSIARIDAGGALRVGPASAGAVPGPICYGRGGTDVTVTDANVALGRLLPSTALPLDAAAITPHLRTLADRLGCGPDDAAEGVIAVINAAMEGALRVISVERGYDPADFTLVPFGGAAGLHAVALAERLEIPRLLVPPAPGVLSAFGMLVAPVRRDAARSVLRTNPESAELEEVFRELDATAAAALLEEGAAADEIRLRRFIDGRYRGQSHELTVPAGDWPGGFHDAHVRRFGYHREGAPLEAVTLRVEATAAPPPIPAPALATADADAAPASYTRVRHDGASVDAAVYRRDSLLAGHQAPGPALILEQTAAFWLPHGWLARVLHDGSLLVQPSAGA